MKFLLAFEYFLVIVTAQTACIFTTWSSWSTCGNDCLQARNRSLQIGDLTNCISEYGPLTNEQICEDGLCGLSTITTTATTTPGPIRSTFSLIGTPTIVTATTTTTTASSSSVEGCRINAVDPGTQPSSFGFKAVGAQGDCNQRCKIETSFACEAFIATGSNGPCLLFGKLDRNISLMQYSKYYLQDLKCATGNGSSIKTCQYQQTGTIRAPDESYSKSYQGIGFAIDSTQCQHLCQMNFPMFQQNPCSIFAYNPSINYEAKTDNCYFFNASPQGALNGTELLLYQILCQ